MLSEIEHSRRVSSQKSGVGVWGRAISKRTSSKHKAELGQFFTPAQTAQFMAGLFDSKSIVNCRLLDAGAGIGSLSAAFLERWTAGGFDFQRVEVDAFEIDADLHPYLSRTLNQYSKKLDILPTIRGADFIHTQ